MRVHHLSCGTLCPFGGRWINGTGAPWQRGKLVSHVLAVETPSAGIVLVDSGFGTADIERPRYRLGPVFPTLSQAVLAREETALARLEALGFSARDVQHIVLTHLDLDHAGGLSDFPHARVHLLADEYRGAIGAPTRSERLRYRAPQFEHKPRFETYEPVGESWNGFPCVRDLRGLPPEILLVPLSGHSRGHTGIAVDDGHGWLLHAGDAYFHHDQMDAIEPRCPSGLWYFQNMMAFDKPQMRANQARLRELARQKATARVRVFSAHDPWEYEALVQRSRSIEQTDDRVVRA